MLVLRLQAQGWQKQLFTQAKDAWIDPKRAYQLVNLLDLDALSSDATLKPPLAAAVPTQR
jgi:hypothetical protein